MNRLVIILFFALSVGLAFSLAPDWNWVDHSSGTGNENVTDAVCDSQGNIFVVGTFTSTVTLGSITLDCQGSQNTFVGKLNHQGEWLWAVPYVGGTNDNPQIAVSTDGVLYITGRFTATYTIMGNSYPSNGGYDLYLLSLNGDGSYRWFISKGGAGDELSTCLDTDSEGNVYISGYFASSALIWDSYNYPNHGSNDIFVAKVSETGNLIWLNTAYSSYNDFSSSISVRNGVFCIGGGTTSIATTYFGTIPIVSDNSGVNPMDGLIGIGNVSTGEWTFATNLWAWGVGYYRQVAVGSVDIDSQNRIIVGGGFCQQVHLGSTILYAADIEMDGFCGQMTINGTWNWAFSFNDAGQNNDYCSVEVDPQDNLLVSSNFRNSLSFSSGFAPVSSLGGWDYLAVKISSSGSFKWTKTIQGSNDENGRVTYDPWGYPIAFGSTSSSPAYFDNGQYNSQGKDLFIAKLDNVSASFSADITTVYTGAPVHFTNTSTCYPLYSQWDFNNDGIVDSMDPNPTYNYTTPGFFTVSLTVTDSIHSSTMTKASYINAILMPETDWMTASRFGGLGTDRICDIVSDADGNLFVTGSFTESVTINDVTYYSLGLNDAFVAKYNASGQCLWFRPAGGSGDEFSNRIILDDYNNLYIAGYYVSSSFNFPGLTPLIGPGINSNGISYAYAAKLDTEGAWLWRIGASSVNTHCEVNDLCVGSDGSLYLAGDYWSNINFGDFSYSGGGAYDGFIAKYSSSGSYLWSTNITGTSYQLVHSISMSPDNNIVLTGQIIGVSTFGPGTFSLTPYGGIDVFVGKIDTANGNWLWVRKGGGSGEDHSTWGGGIACSSDGSIFVSITIQSQLSYWGDLPELNLNGTTKGAYIAKMSADGEWLWLRGNLQSSASAVNLVVTQDAYTYLTGSFSGRTFFDDYQLDSRGSDDIFVVKFDPVGDVLWAMSAGGSGSDTGICLSIDPAGSMYVGGTFNGTAYFQSSSLSSAGGQDGFIARIEIVISEFSASVTSGRCPLLVDFTDLSVGVIDSWAWDFDNDGTIDSNQQNPSWTYNQSGYYSVALTVTSGSVTESSVKENYIHVYFFDPDFAADVTEGYVPLTVYFTDITEGTIISNQWDFNNDGTVDATGSDAVWTYLFPGIYTVSLTDSDINGPEVETKVDYIHVSLNPAIAHYVPQDFPTIQAAIAHCVDGDYIIVADGVYHENLNLLGKDITIASWFIIDGDSAHITNTIIDGGNPQIPDEASTITIIPHQGGRPFSRPHIVGFTIRNGSGRRVLQNIGGSTVEKRVGGGIYIHQSNPMFSHNRIVDNDADDEGGGSYAFQGLPNHGGMVNPAIGLFNPGGNYYANNSAEVGADIYIEGVTARDALGIANCSFEVMSVADTTVSNYWVNSSAAIDYTGSSGRHPAITTDIWVATDGNDISNSGSQSSPFRTIDHALSRAYATADNPLIIHIAAGTYSPSLTGEKYPLQMVKHVSLQGAGKDQTFLDAEASADFPRRVVNMDKVDGVTISDMTLMNGFVTLAKNYNGGGLGIIASSATLSHLIIAGNSSAGNGSGLFALDSTVQADSVEFHYNSALGSGGGIHSVDSGLSLSGSTFSNNSVSKNGAGLSISGGLIDITDCLISYNQATGYQSKGGGISLAGTASASLKGNTLHHNTADNGAGIYLQDNTGLILDRAAITHNLADYSGGGIFLNTSSGTFTNLLLANNTATQRGGGMYCYSSPQLTNSTIAHNKAGIQGGGIYLASGSPTSQNCVLWGNAHSNPATANQLYIYSPDSAPAFTYCDVQDGVSGFALAPGLTFSGNYTFNLEADPLFTEPATGPGSYYEATAQGYSLQESSPCIDSGDPATDVSAFSLDLGGTPRIDAGFVDIGAWEYQHFNGARIVAGPNPLDFGRVNISSGPSELIITITNSGNQPLVIASITLQQSGTDFSYSCAHIGESIAAGASVPLVITFHPQSTGPLSALIAIYNNSLNANCMQIPLAGFGIDASSSQPSNISVQLSGYDVHLDWDPVLSYPNGDPFTPSCYAVLYHVEADTPLDSYLFLDLATDTAFTHTGVAYFHSRMFYRVIAIGPQIRAALEFMRASGNREAPITWGDVKKALIRSRR